MTKLDKIHTYLARKYRKYYDYLLRQDFEKAFDVKEGIKRYLSVLIKEGKR